MAAILCQSIASLCSGVTSLLSLPCRGLGTVISSPFFPYLAVTTALNVPPVVWGIQDTFQCHWLAINAILSAIHILASIYIVYKIQQQQQEHVISIDEEQQGPDKPIASEYVKHESTTTTSTTNTTSNSIWNHWKAMHDPTTPETHPNSLHRMSQVLCYDTTVAIYIVIAVSWMVWQSLGLSNLLFQHDDQNCKHVAGALICGLLYMMLVCISFGCSLVTMQ